MIFVNKIRKKKLGPFVLRFLLFIFILFLFDFTVGKILRHFYYKQSSGLLYRTTYSMDSTRAEILIFGSSTANHHYYPGAFEDRLHMSVYNTGRDGNSIFYHYSVLQSILERYAPKIAILDFNIGEFRQDQKSYDRISSLLPYYEEHPELGRILELKSPFEKYKLISKIYPFNSQLFTIAVGNTAFNKSRSNIIDEDGYLPLSRIWRGGTTNNSSKSSYELDSNKIFFFKAFIEDCLTHKVKLYIVNSPRLIKYSYDDTSIAIAKEITNQLNVPFYDFANEEDFFDHPQIFADTIHLNDTGARIYSNKVIDKIINNNNAP